MMCRVLATYLVLAMAAGPTLCCCSLTRLMGSLQQADDRGDFAAKSCCRTQTMPSAPTPGDSAGEGDSAPAPPQKPDCPCKARWQAAAAVAPEPPVPEPDQVRLVLLELIPFAFSLSVQSDRMTPSAGGDPPPRFIAARDLLHAHHLLRC